MGKRAAHDIFKPGTILEHASGSLIARCEFIAPNDVIYDHEHYTSLSAAAIAAAEDLGMKSTSLNGWKFWKELEAGGNGNGNGGAARASVPRMHIGGRRAIDQLVARAVEDLLRRISITNGTVSS